MTILFILGSRNPNGQTARAAQALADGVKGLGGTADVGRRESPCEDYGLNLGVETGSTTSRI